MVSFVVYVLKDGVISALEQVGIPEVESRATSSLLEQAASFGKESGFEECQRVFPGCQEEYGPILKEFSKGEDATPIPPKSATE